MPEYPPDDPTTIRAGTPFRFTSGGPGYAGQGGRVLFIEPGRGPGKGFRVVWVHDQDGKQYATPWSFFRDHVELGMAEEVEPTVPPRPSSGAEDVDVGTFYANGIVSGRTGKPLVDLRWGHSKGLLTPHELAEHVQMLMREAWWADSDAALLSWFQQKLNMTVEQAGGLLVDFREHRLAQLDAAAAEKIAEHRAAYDAWAKREVQERQKQGGE